MNPAIFREYDIRGVYEKDFDPTFAYNLGRAYVRFHQRSHSSTKPVISLGHDARLSSPKIVEALSRGLKDSGAKVLLLGLVTTPMTYFSGFALQEVNGSIMVTGSHNPPDYNGFKISVGQTTIYGSDILELRDIIESQDYIDGTGSIEEFDISETYVQRYKEEFGNLGELPIVIDCGNGTAGCIVRKLYESLGLKPTILFEEPDGKFPNHHPDPTVLENLQDLIRAVKENKARVGIGFDGDSDRIGIVDHNGDVVYGDEFMVIIARDLLEQKSGQTIVGDVKCSDKMFEAVEKAGGKAIMWKTGHSLVKQKIKEEGAPFGGELSGHIFFADRNYGYDDALYAGLRLIEIMIKTQKTLPELLGDLPKTYSTPEIRIDTTEQKKIEIVDNLIQEYSKPSPDYTVNLTDGVRVSYPNAWALARASNTQPVLVMRFEAQTQEELNKIRQEFEQKVKAWM